MSTKDTNRRIENSALILAASTPSRPRTAADAMFQAGMSSDECSNKKPTEEGAQKENGN